MQFAKVGEEVFLRRKELKTDEEKRFQFETFFLYLLILFHTWDDTGLCRKSVPEICEIWGLDYDNSMRRYKLLREKGWVEEVIINGETYLRPLVGVKTRKNTILPDSETVESTAQETVKSTVEKRAKTVKSTVENCKVYSKKGRKTVKSTVAFKGITEPLKRQSQSEPTTTEKTDVVVGKNGHLSKFSLEEILRYVDLCAAEGQTVKNRTGLANYLYESGEKDALISAKLFPENSEFTETEKTRAEALALLLDLQTEDPDAVLGFEKWYSPEDWAYLMEELEKCRIATN